MPPLLKMLISLVMIRRPMGQGDYNPISYIFNTVLFIMDGIINSVNGIRIVAAVLRKKSQAQG